MTTCVKCGRQYVYDKKKGHNRTKCNSCVMNARRPGAKQRAVEYKGGQCQACGYKRCIRALVFHHLDPTQKDFGPANKIGSISWDKLELDKCVLLCSNCHAEVHEGLVTL